jgi:hypothetical protein
MTHRPNGQIDGQGTLSVKIRISRFFTIRASARADYVLRGAQKERQPTKGIEARATALESAAKLANARV